MPVIRLVNRSLVPTANTEDRPLNGNHYDRLELMVNPVQQLGVQNQIPLTLPEQIFAVAVTLLLQDLVVEKT